MIDIYIKVCAGLLGGNTAPQSEGQSLYSPHRSVNLLTDTN